MNKNEVDNCKKALIVTTVASTLDQFCMNEVSILQKTHDIYVAANFDMGNNTSVDRVKEFKLELQKKNIIANEINFNRSPLSKGNFFAYKDIENLINSESFEIIHCHTPVAAMMVRLAARKARKNGTKVIYTAHGFHFFKGAPFINWLIFYSVERWLARYTDVLITINKEDYARAKKSFKVNRIEYIHGVGIDPMRFSEIVVDKLAMRRELDVPEDAFILLSVGELNKNKNHETVIRAIANLNNPKIYYVVCGQGVLENYLKGLSNKLGIDKQMKLLGFRKDIAEICKAADMFVLPSFREGLSVALMEAMASGLPVVCSNIRGNNDLIQDGKGGYLIEPTDVGGFHNSIKRLFESEELRADLSKNNLEQVKKYYLDNVKKEMVKIYGNCD